MLVAQVFYVYSSTLSLARNEFISAAWPAVARLDRFICACIVSLELLIYANIYKTYGPDWT